MPEAHKACAKRECESWPEGKVNKKHLAYAAIKTISGLAETSELCYGAVHYPTFRRFLVPDFNSVAVLLGGEIVCP